MDLRVQMDAKFGQLKNGKKSQIFSAPAFQDQYKGAQKGAPKTALKGALQVAPELHLFMQLSMDTCLQNDSVKGEIEVASMLNLKTHLRFHSRELLKLHKKLMIPLSVQ